MAKDLLLPGSILSLHRSAVEKLLKAGNGDAALLYLYLLGHGNAAGLNWPRERLQGALDLLSAQGMAGAEAAPPPPASSTCTATAEGATTSRTARSRRCSAPPRCTRSTERR